ncbi:MAG: M18 family aminopeptidase [Acidimicrobiales bacterium]
MTAAESARALCAFIDASPSPYHAVASAANQLEAAGFTRLEENEAWGATTGRRYVVRDASLVAWSLPEHAAGATPWRVIGAHTDSPNLRVKPRADLARAGARLLAVEVYGAPLLNSWLDRDLGLSGRVGLRDGTTELLRVDKPLLRIPQLAIHLDRDIATSGLVLNPQMHMTPMWGLGEPDVRGFSSFVADEIGAGPTDVVSWELMVHDLTPSQLAGRDDEFVSAPRLDNLCSSWAAVQALTADPAPVSPALVALFDHEETGSTSSRGADSPMLEAVLERIAEARGSSRAELRQALAGSMCASADMAHATHPNYSERHEPGHWVALNGGPVIKTNASQRYATDARTAGAFVSACDRAAVPLQHFVSRNDMRCGSTIGPITAGRLGIATVDVGAPQLAMHAAREVMGSLDPASYVAALAAWLRPEPAP